MLKSEMQHQFWVTKKAVQRRLGSREDECIVSSDAELDAKIELFKSISESCGHLYRIIDHYQERLCILAQEENALGKFLKETGKNSNTTGKVMQSAGKAISYCGQQRMTIRPSLLRLHHEMETFRGRAIADTHATIVLMEKERTEYRAALSWMKSASNQLDPDSGRGVEKFRKAQTHVRLAKTKFDRLSLDCLQKIDLLAAARCNMFSHALVAYMSALLQYATKTSETFKATVKALSTSPQYNFCILRDLSQNPVEDAEEKQDVAPLDSDQMLFFLDDYKDEKNELQPKESQAQKPEEQSTMQSQNPCSFPALVDISTSEDIAKEIKTATNLLDNNDLLSGSQSKPQVPSIPANAGNNSEPTTLEKLLGLTDDFGDFVSSQSEPLSFMPSRLLLGDDIGSLVATDLVETGSELTPVVQNAENPPEIPKNKSSILDFFNISSLNKQSTNSSEGNQQKSTSNSLAKSKDKAGKKDMSAWFNLFAELDPLANPDAMARKIDGGKDNSQAA